MPVLRRPAAQFALMHRAVVDERRWVSDRRFLQALNFCTLLPGPEAMQLATYLGWLMHGVPGGLVAGVLFVLPGAAVMLALSLLYAGFGSVPVQGSLDVAAVLLAVATGIALRRYGLGVVPVLAGCAVAGVVMHILGAN